MKKVLFTALAVIGLSGCAMKGSRIPAANIMFAKADYTVMGETTEEACGTYIIGIDFAHLFKNEGNAPPMSIMGLIMNGVPAGGKEESRALYHAMAKIPEATHLLDIRTEAEFNGVGLLAFPLFGQRCARVHARGVKIGSRPNPQQ